MSPASAPPAPPKTGGAGSAPAGPIENAEIAKERKEVKLSISLVCNNGLRLHQQALAPGVESQAPGPRRNWRSGRIEKISSGKQIYTKLLTPPSGKQIYTKLLTPPPPNPWDLSLSGQQGQPG